MMWWLVRTVPYVVKVPYPADACPSGIQNSEYVLRYCGVKLCTSRTLLMPNGAIIAMHIARTTNPKHALLSIEGDSEM